MRNIRTKVIIGLVAILTAGSLFALKGKMRHHKIGRAENCEKMKSMDGDTKCKKHKSLVKLKSKQDLENQ